MADAQFPSNAPTVTEILLSLTDVTTANVSTTKHGLCPKLPNDASKFLDGTGAYSTPGGGGGGSVPSGSAVYIEAPMQGSPDSGYTGLSIMYKLSGYRLLCLPTSWKISMDGIVAGGSYVVSKAVVLRTAVDSLTVLDSTQIFWSSSGTPTLTGPLLSDAISLALDNTHDYWIVIYFTSTSGNLNIGPTAWLANTVGSSVTAAPASGYKSGDQTGVSTIAYPTAECEIFRVLAA